MGVSLVEAPGSFQENSQLLWSAQWPRAVWAPRSGVRVLIASGAVPRGTKSGSVCHVGVAAAPTDRSGQSQESAVRNASVTCRDVPVWGDSVGTHFMAQKAVFGVFFWQLLSVL